VVGVKRLSIIKKVEIPSSPVHCIFHKMFSGGTCLKRNTKVEVLQKIQLKAPKAGCPRRGSGGSLQSNDFLNQYLCVFFSACIIDVIIKQFDKMGALD